MLSEKQKRDAQLSILEKLRKKGAPGKEPSDNEMNGMFDLGVGEDGKIAYNEGEEEEPTEGTEEELKKPKLAIPPQNVLGGPARPKKPSKKSLL